MTTFALLHGAWHGAWSWSLLVEELEKLGHAGVAVDLPAGDPACGASGCADVVLSAGRDLRPARRRAVAALSRHDLPGLIDA
jgi:hypothetical protein